MSSETGLLDLRNQTILREQWQSLRQERMLANETTVDLSGLRVAGAVFPEGVDFSNAWVSSEETLGPFEVAGVLDFTNCRFRGVPEISWTGSPLALFSAARFEDSVRLRPASGYLVCDDVTFCDRLSLVATNDRTTGEDRPTLMSLEGVDGDGLTVAGVDISCCHFWVSTNLDRARIEVRPLLFHGRPRFGLRGRQMVAEEFLLRENQRSWNGQGSPIRFPDQLAALVPDGSRRSRGIASRWHRFYGTGDDEDANYRQVAATYRGLRLGQERDGDTPIANDLYFGEMTMRRLGARRRGRLRNGYLVWVLISGYQAATGFGLRPLRPATWFFLVLLAVASVLALDSALGDGQGFMDSLAFTARTLVLLPDADGVTSSRLAEGIQVPLRIAGPLLIGSVALCIRARTQR